MQLSVIISTYNSAEWLNKVLIGFSVQNFQDFEIIIADDGSDERTKWLLEKYQHSFKALKHIWHKDEGFRKCKILNKAVLAAGSDYLVFTDGDCIPRKDFLQEHMDRREEECFLSGGYFKLPLNISEEITAENIIRQNCFDLHWLKKRGLKKSFKNTKLSKSTLLTNVLNATTVTKPTWNGHNASGWKKDILAVNGFNEEMKYGGEDRELGERLINNELQGIQIRYSAICVHLDHSRPYIHKDDLEKNKRIRLKTAKNNLTWTKKGIIKGKLAHQMNPD